MNKHNSRNKIKKVTETSLILEQLNYIWACVLNHSKFIEDTKVYCINWIESELKWPLSVS